MANSRIPGLYHLIRNLPLQQSYKVSELLIKEKRIGEKSLLKCSPPLHTAVALIVGYYHLKRDVEACASIKYSAKSLEHESTLLKLWTALNPDTPLKNRISKQWQDIGFQGDDPATDFRGMGILGLIQLLFLCEANFDESSDSKTNEDSHAVRTICQRSLRSDGYPFACVGINITNLTKSLLMHDHLKWHLWNVCSESGPTMQDFHQAYCTLFFRFDKSWWETEVEPQRQLEKFNIVYKKLGDDVITYLSSADNAVLNITTLPV